jgi:hypothetical protein
MNKTLGDLLVDYYSYFTLCVAWDAWDIILQVLFLDGFYCGRLGAEAVVWHNSQIKFNFEALQVRQRSEN